ncbi:MAG: peptide chain release factor N(5)-glutamine methyltransferase [Bacteroidales bacterium]|nr:peptide chain release factor N(5)-glutamine methyltransferase [Bacteroidales bacterium]
MSDLTIQYQFNNLVKALERLYPMIEAESIAYAVIEHVLNYSKFRYAELRQEMFPKNKLEEWNKILTRLLIGEPVQYITGSTQFYGLNFKLTPAVLIPRPETEEMTDLILKENSQNLLKILDIGTGSGCIAVSLKNNRKNWNVSATDISKEVIEIAHENAINNDTKIHFYIDDIFNSNVFKETQRFDIIVSNPPYIPLSEKRNMHKNVTDFEPHIALFVPDENPVKYYKALVDFSNLHLDKKGKIYMEVHESYANEVRKVFIESGFQKTEIIPDINKKPRIVKSAFL